MTAKEVLDECRISDRPIPLEAIIQHYGITPVRLSATGDIFGAIVRENGGFYIAVNPDQHPNRQRFTIAHELAHFILHYKDSSERIEHVDTDFRVSWRNHVSSQGVDWNEIEANRFAAELLMPEHMLRPDVDKFGMLDDDALQRLAALYKVSRLAMRFRLINLGLLPPEVDPSGE
ncbi:MAG TPA: ImmA/IrrE family metallo-endopeptidase [Terriglobales bacterium]|nr:ImmA/IrrE family metallo-endopeptidase [Terriglobales bacterium]